MIRDDSSQPNHNIPYTAKSVYGHIWSHLVTDQPFLPEVLLDGVLPECEGDGQRDGDGEVVGVVAAVAHVAAHPVQLGVHYVVLKADDFFFKSNTLSIFYKRHREILTSCVS